MEEQIERNGLVIGSTGLIGRHLTLELREYSSNLVIAGYNKRIPTGLLAAGGLIEKVDVADKESIRAVVEKRNIGTIYNLAAGLSIEIAKNPEILERVNRGGLENVIELAKEYSLRVFYPSSIAVYGPKAPRVNVPENAELDPITDYGKDKIAGEKKIRESGIDGRMLRIPGVIGPGEHGDGTTEYAIDMIYAALNNQPYESPLEPNTELPMIDVRDLVHAVRLIMEAPRDQIQQIGYNAPGYSFTPAELGKLLMQLFPRSSQFRLSYRRDPGKQEIADSWPNSIDGLLAFIDFRYKPQHGIKDTSVYLSAAK